MQPELKITCKITHKLKLTPQMRLAISLLQMPLLKLKDYLKQQIQENPLLEADPRSDSNIPEVNRTIGLGAENYNFDEEERDYRETLITNPTTLQGHLLEQLHLLSDTEDERKIGGLLIENIDDNGYLGISLKEAAESIKAMPSQVERVLNLIQTFDPIGVGARDLRECLLLQINPVRNTEYTGRENKISNGVKAKGEENSLVGQIIDKYLPYLEKKRFEFIAKKLKVSVERIKEAIKEIANLEPKPGRSFNPRTKDFGAGVNAERAVRLIADVILKRNNNNYEVIFNDWELPSLNLNPKYKRMLKQEDIAEDTKEYLKERLQAAKFLITAMNKRKETIRKVTEAIVYIQKDFFNGMYTPTPIESKKKTAMTIGVGVNLKPMTLSQIANLVGKHKSTVSRTVNNKYLQTPDGIFELRRFLNSGLKQENGEFYSSRAIKSKLQELIENENKETPLTDQEVVNLLRQEGISISRRSIAKYRHQLKILSSQSRRE